MKYLYFLFLVISSSCYGYTKENFYSVNSDGWKVSEMSEESLTEVFKCGDCGGIVQIQVTYGREGINQVYSSTESIISKMTSNASIDSFIMTIVSESTPWLSKGDISILKANKNSKLGGRPAIEFSILGKSKLVEPTIERTFIAIQKNRLMRLSIHYYKEQEALIKKDKINAFINSFKYL